MIPARLAPSSLALLLACGGAGASTGVADTTDASTSDAPEPTTGDPSSTSGTTEPAAQTVTVEVVRYTTQAQVVDVKLTTNLAADSLTLVHPDDPGVRIAPLAVDGLTTTFRVRGLAPDLSHSLQYDVDGLTGPVDFITYPPKPGFQASFPVEGGNTDAAMPYRMFDLIPWPQYDTASLFVVDADGVTRWHTGGPSTNMPGPEGIYTSAKLRADGSVMFLHNHIMHVRDELDTHVVEMTDDQIGVTGLHHELIELPSGNFMALAFSFREVDYGPDGVRNTAGDMLVEFTPAGELVWTWDTFDHLDPHRVSEPFSTATVIHPVSHEVTYDWTHGNAIVHDPATDTLLYSSRHQDWLILIDHKTGDVLWKLGHDGDFTLKGDGAWFYHQHAPEWQADGTLLLYDNGITNPDLQPSEVHSRAVRYALDFDAMTAERVWMDDGPQITATFTGNADRLPGGHILVTDSSLVGMSGFWAQLRELDDAASPMLQWSLRSPDGSYIYRGSAHDRLIGQPAP